MRLAALPLLLAALPVGAADGVVVRDAWIRAAPPGMDVLAGYATIENRGSTPVVLVSAESTAFDTVELHEMTMLGGVMKMRMLERVEIAPAASASLEPGAKHLMLRRPHRPVAPGDRIDVTLVDAAGARTIATFEVK